jgi:hypothetical protein
MEPTEEMEKHLSDSENVPLTKSKGGRPKNPPKVKEKKPRTEKQIEAFNKAQQKIKEIREKKKEEKKIEASKLLLEKGIELPVLFKKELTENETTPLTKKQPKPQPVLNLPPEEGQDTGPEEEEEIVYIKKDKKVKPIPKKKRKKIIVYQDNSSDSESDSSSDEEIEEEEDLKPKHFKSQRNKKSLIKVYDTPQHKPKPPLNHSTNYFCD